jgi:ribokinase
VTAGKPLSEGGRVGRVVVVGAVNVDMVVAAPALPGPGETVVGPRMERFGGGKGANAAVAASRAGARVTLIGAVGADDIGAAAVAELQADGVDTSGVAELVGAATGVALIVVDAAGENQIAVGAGANAALAAEAVTTALASVLPGAGCVLVSTEIPDAAVLAAVRAAAAAGVVCVLNPAPVTPAVVELATGGGPLLTPNRTECLDLAGRLGGPVGDVAAAAGWIRERTGAAVVVTLGGAGVLVVAADGTPQRVPARPATVRDTTGAGDTFNGVLAAGLAAGDPPDLAVRVAGVAASLSVAHAGARGGMPTAAAIHAAT